LYPHLLTPVAALARVGYHALMDGMNDLLCISRNQHQTPDIILPWHFIVVWSGVACSHRCLEEGGGKTLSATLLCFSYIPDVSI